MEPDKISDSHASQPKRPKSRPFASPEEHKIEWEKSQKSIEHEKIVAMTKNVEESIKNAANDFQNHSDFLDPTFDDTTPLVTANGMLMFKDLSRIFYFFQLLHNITFYIRKINSIHLIICPL